jgi:hypothetical protein
MNANDSTLSGFSVRPMALEGCDPLPPISAPVDRSLNEIEAESFVRGQIIVTGRASDIEDMLRVSGQVQANDLIQEIELDPWPPEEGVEVSARDLETPVIRIYQVSEAIAEQPMGRLMSQFIQARDPSRRVYVEPNYVIGLPLDAEIKSNPECVEGGPAGKSVEAGKNMFWRQWAFGNNGIRLIANDGGKMTRTVSAMGSGIRVGIFDSSSFPSAGGYHIDGGPFSQSSQGYHATWQNQDPSILKVCVSHPDHYISSYSTGETDLCDHGLFVASLVHSVAPGCDIDLIRVLDDRGRGRLSTLLYALKAYLKRAQALEGETLQRTVLNLSLSVYAPAGPQALGMEPELDAPEFGLGTRALGVGASLRSMSLESLLSDIHKAGAVIVSSTGNDSVHEATAQSAMPPAGYPYVLGVAGSNIARGRARYSNAGDVAAPGGDDRPGCSSLFKPLGARYDGRVVGLSMNTSETSHYAYWSGTSFAAPLVSGLAALVLEQRHNVAGPNDVYDRIKNRAIVTPDPGLGTGIVDVPNTLK